MTQPQAIPTRPSPRERLLSPAELADWLGVSPGWVRDHATRKEPRLPVVRLGKLLRFRTEEVEQFLQQQGVAQ